MPCRSAKLFETWSPISLIFCTLACTSAPLPLQIDKYCVSDSGLSKYLIRLNIANQTGNIGYRYMRQDVRYTIRSMEINGSQLVGHADFQSSSTGEVRGTPIYFTYDNETSVFTDGQMNARCVDWHENEVR